MQNLLEKIAETQKVQYLYIHILSKTKQMKSKKKNKFVKADTINLLSFYLPWAGWTHASTTTWLCSIIWCKRQDLRGRGRYIARRTVVGWWWALVLPSCWTPVVQMVILMEQFCFLMLVLLRWCVHIARLIATPMSLWHFPPSHCHQHLSVTTIIYLFLYFFSFLS